MNLFKNIFRSEKGFAPIIAVIAIALVAAAVPTTIILVQQEQDNRQLAQYNTTGLPVNTELCANYIEYYECNGNEILVKKQASGTVTNRPKCDSGTVCAVSNSAANCVKCVAPPTPTRTPSPTPALGCDPGYACVSRDDANYSEVCDTSAATIAPRVQCSNYKGLLAHCCKRKSSGVVATPIPNTPVPPISTPNPRGGGSTPPPAAPTPTPTMPSEIGYCANDARGNVSSPINGATCDITNPNVALWKKRTTTNPEGHDPYCKHIGGNQADYFFECVSPTPPPTTTPTPYQPLPEGGSCNPLQGTWQCEGGSYCSQACSSNSASCTTGRCCPYGKSWNGSSCVADPTPTEPPAAQPSATPAPPIDTGDACPDVNPGTNPPVFNVCRPAGSGCLTAEGETPKSSQAAHDTCSNFYGGSYLCCQRAPQQGAAGSSCNLNPRRCDTSKNSSNGTNIQCTGCGGYCVPDSSGQGICMSQ